MNYQYQSYYHFGMYKISELNNPCSIILETDDKFESEAMAQYLNECQISPEDAWDIEYIYVTGAYIRTDPPQEYYRIINVRKVIEDTTNILDTKEEAKKVCNILNKKENN